MAAPTTVLNFAVGQRLKASVVNLLVMAVGELQPSPGWTTGSLGSSPISYYAYRTHGWYVDLRGKLVYSSAPSSLNLTVAAVPSAVYPQNPGGSVNSALPVVCFGSIGASGTREVLPCLLSIGGQLQVRGGASNPSSWDTFEFVGGYSVA